MGQRKEEETDGSAGFSPWARTKSQAWAHPQKTLGGEERRGQARPRRGQDEMAEAPWKKVKQWRKWRT